jgi:hypothetical protein
MTKINFRENFSKKNWKLIHEMLQPDLSRVILSALGQVRAVLFLGFTPKGLIPF